MTRPDETLGAVVADDPSRARLLDRLGLDYCCGGDETLEHACARSGLDPSDVVAQLDASAVVADDHDCRDMGPADLAAHLVGLHHAYLHGELPALGPLAQKVLVEHGARHEELHEVVALVDALRAELEPHLLKEERVLFPAILRLVHGPAQFPFGPIANPIQVMAADHDHAGELLTRLRAVTNGYAAPGDACASYRLLYRRLAELEHDIHLHVFEENHFLFPRALALGARTSEDDR